MSWRLPNGLLVFSSANSSPKLGAGRLAVCRLLAAIPDLGRKPCYVEQEGSSDSLASARRNFGFLRALEF